MVLLQISTGQPNLRVLQSLESVPQLPKPVCGSDESAIVITSERPSDVMVRGKNFGLILQPDLSHSRRAAEPR